MATVHVEEILQEIADDWDSSPSVASLSQAASATSASETSTSSKPTLTVDIIARACNTLHADQNMPHEVRTTSHTCNRQEILQHMQFLQDCLEPKGCFTANTKEKSWSKFYAAMTCDTNVEKLDQLLTEEVTPFLCFEVFGLLLDSYCEQPQQEMHTAVELEISDVEKDILSYIGGAVLQKLKQRAYRLKNADNKEDINYCIQSLTADCAESGSMTAILDRGGLIKLTVVSKAIFVELESVFRSLFSGDVSKLSLTEFLQISQQSVATTFYEATYKVEVNASVKEKVLRDLIALFFNIRAHHKCKMYMDDVRKQSHKCNREKALRKRLKNAKN